MIVQVVDRHVAGRIVAGPDIDDVAAVLHAAHLDRLLRAGARIVNRHVVEGEVAVEAEQQDVAASAGAGRLGRVTDELRVLDGDAADRVGMGRGRAVALLDIGEAIELGVLDDSTWSSSTEPAWAVEFAVTETP